MKRAVSSLEGNLEAALAQFVGRRGLNLKSIGNWNLVSRRVISETYSQMGSQVRRVTREKVKETRTYNISVATEDEKTLVVYVVLTYTYFDRRWKANRVFGYFIS